MMKSHVMCAAAVAIIGVLFLAAGVSLRWVFEKVVHDRIISAVQLRNGSQAFDAWQDPPVTVYMQFWVFNLTNSQEVLNDGAKPKVQELGPYTYREIRPKEDIVFSSNGADISFKNPKAFVFEPELSVGNENDSIISVNLPILTIASKFHLFGFVWKEILKLTGESLFGTYTVGGYLFGYEDPALKEINGICKKYLHKPCIEEDKFGLFYGPTGNGSDDGVYKVGTGSGDIKELNEIIAWNDTSKLTYWNTSECNMINGTDGSLWHPFISTDETLYIFSTQVCRSIYVTYHDTRTSHGIELYRFVPPPDVFANSSLNPANAGFCVPECLDSGVLDISGCIGAPIIISQPHFYQGAEQYINAVDGLHPSSQHATHVDVEPYTGAVMNAAKKLQLNAYIKPVDGVTGKLEKIIFPLIWLNESAVIDETTAQQFREQVIAPITLLQWVHIGVIILGASVLFVALIMIFINCFRSKSDDVLAVNIQKGDTEPILDESSYT